MILPATAVRTGGWCMRCVGKKADAEHREFIRKNRREVNPYAGLTDAAEIILAFHGSKKIDPLISYLPPPQPIEQLYGALTAQQAQKLIAAALDCDDVGLTRTIARSLATLTDHDISELQSSMAETGDYWPAVAFRGSPPEVRDSIVDFLESRDAPKEGGVKIDHALSSLAWIGDQTVQQKFASWESRHPPWRKLLHVGPHRYAHVGGWELRGGHRRDLFHRECWAITTAASESDADPNAQTCTPADGICPWCDRPLVHLLELNLHDPRLAFVSRIPSVLKVLTCESCNFFSEALFARVDSAGSATWHESNVVPKFLPKDAAEWDPFPWRHHACRLVRRGAMQTADASTEVDASQIGGLPTWVQDTAYPKCPDCGQTMTFIAQLDNSRFEGEGVHYAFLCAPCGVTATNYQQT